MTPRALMTLLAALVVAAAGLGPALAQEVEPEPVPPIEPTAVAAFIDTGINPYHETFRDDTYWAYQHPSTYIPGYPEDAIALPITLYEDTWSTAVKADCDLWRSVEPGQLYWFPGTKIIGAISFIPEVAPKACHRLPRGEIDDPAAEILDYNGHGTMVASRGASIEYGACRDCRIVAAQMVGYVDRFSAEKSTDESIAPIEWAAANAHWIDVQSNSWGPLYPGWDPTGKAGIQFANPELVAAIEATSSAHPSFWASMNGAAGRYGVAGHPTPLSPHLTPSAIMVGGHDSGHVNIWPGFPPHVVSDSCAAWAAAWDSPTHSDEDISSGTSGATPFAAGGAVRILLEARRILGDLGTGIAEGDVMASGTPGAVTSGPLADGQLTEDELRGILFRTATARPAAQFEDGPTCGVGLYGPTPVKWVDVPAAYPEYLHIGYGAVDGPALDLAFDVLRGEASLPDRTRTDEFFATDRQVRSTTHQVFDGLP